MAFAAWNLGKGCVAVENEKVYFWRDYEANGYREFQDETLKLDILATIVISDPFIEDCCDTLCDSPLISNKGPFNNEELDRIREEIRPSRSP